MNKECRKVQAMMSLYIDNVLSDELKNFISSHLKKCEICNEYYLKLKKTIDGIKMSFDKVKNSIENKYPLFSIKKYEDFKENVSAYFDNELSSDEVLNMHKYMVETKPAREFMSNALKSYNLYKSVLKKSAPQINKDLSKKVMAAILPDEYGDLRKILTLILSVVILLCSIGLYITKKHNIFIFHKKHSIYVNSQINFS